MTHDEHQVMERLNRCSDLEELDAIQFEFGSEIEESNYLSEQYDNAIDRLYRSINVRRMF